MGGKTCLLNISSSLPYNNRKELHPKWDTVTSPVMDVWSRLGNIIFSHLSSANILSPVQYVGF